jgi:two-component system phosphate regulon sensor histidine kinase PhoR
MNGPLRKVVLVLILLVIIPGQIFLFLQLRALRENESMLDALYQRQLDTILFAVNQYAFETVRGWQNRLEETIRTDGTAAMLNRETATPLRAALLADSADVNFTPVAPFAHDANIQIQADSILQTNRQSVNRLWRTARLGYSKPETFYFTSNQERLLLMLIVPRGDFFHPKILALVISPQEFVQTVLVPKLTEIAGDQFVTAVLEGEDLRPVYTNPPLFSGSFNKSSKLWLLPDYRIGITLPGESAGQLGEDRFKLNLLLVLLIDLFLIVAGILIFRSVKKEVHLAQLKADFVSNVSHELRTPLALIRMYAETLELGRVRTEDKKQEYYRIIMRESERLSRLINNILNFSRMDSGRKPYQHAPVDINELVQSVFSDYNEHIRAEGFSFSLGTADNLPEISGDSEAIRESLINLIDNAVKYSPDEKVIKIQTAQNGGQILISVTDHGMGIPEKAQHRIFEKFYRVESGLVHRTKGSGLGLALVKHIMDAHGGRITVDSQTGRGSTFILHFPRSQKEHNT